MASSAQFPTSPAAPRPFARNVALGSLVELFIVSAVASLLLIRAGLALSGFPKLGGGGLHIAHMLWGGLLMLVSLVVLMSFLGRPVLYVAAFLSGIGFGTFIDELGKFITSDNNYFFRPAIAIVYVVFVVLFLTGRALDTRRRFSERELIANAFDMARDLRLLSRRPAHLTEVLVCLRDHAADDPLLHELRRVLAAAEDLPPLAPAWLLRLQEAAQRRYLGLVESRRLHRVLIWLFAAYAILVVLALVSAATLFAAAAAAGRSVNVSFGYAGVAELGAVAAELVVISMVIVGVARIHRSRLSAFSWFERAVLVDILTAQVFQFYATQFGALVGLGVDLALLLIIKGMIRVEHRTALQRVSALAVEEAAPQPRA